MRKFSKILESKKLPSNDNIEDTMQELLDDGIKLTILDGYIDFDGDDQSSFSENIDDFKTDGLIYYSKAIIFRLRIKDKSLSIGTGLFRTFGVSSSRMDIVDNDTFSNSIDNLNNIIKYLKRINVNYYVCLELPNVKIFIVGDKISNDDNSYITELLSKYSQLLDELNDCFRSNKIPLSAYHFNQGPIYVRSNNRIREDKFISTFSSLMSGEEDDEYKHIKPIRDIYNKYLNDGYQIVVSDVDYSDDKFKVNIKKYEY